jgi:hypothetical protein
MRLTVVPLLLGLATAAEEAAEGGESALSSSSSSDAASTAASALLTAARGLEAPPPTARYGGEDENSDWWDEREELLRSARREWGRKHPDLYEWTRAFRESYLDPALLRVLEGRNETGLRELLEPTQVEHVYRVQLFRPGFAERLLEELDHHEASRIPLRRPNGMNRYGAILGDLGFDDLTSGLAGDVLILLARWLFPRHVGPRDVTDHYAFAVRYRPGQDVELAEHADASVVTVNVCLEPDPSNDEVLYFTRHRYHSRPPLPWNNKGASGRDGAEDSAAAFVELSRPGEAVVHLGQVAHGVAPVGGRRSNLVVWLFGERGDVRVAEYGDAETANHAEEAAAFWSRRGAIAQAADRGREKRDSAADEL